MKRVFSAIFFALTAIPSAFANSHHKLPPPIIELRIESSTVQISISDSARSKAFLIQKRYGSGEFKNFTRSKAMNGTFQTLDNFTHTGEDIFYRARGYSSKKRKSRWSKPVEARYEMAAAAPLPDPTSAPAPNATPAPPPPDTVCDNDVVQQVIDETNKVRLENGSSVLTQNSQLTDAAFTHSETMAQLQKLTHDKWNIEILTQGYIGHSYSQNIAKYLSNPAILVEAWLNSKEHHYNLLNPKWSEIGVGCYVDSNGVIWWTQNFGVF